MSDQIKMFIAGEEVVSQNEFTINEEMLSASSTILNNCYPKSWELTKDYISNFYYPKDYSRFVIGQGEYLHGNNEFEPLEITGKNLFQVNDLTNGIVKSYNSGEININGIITGSAYYSQIGTTTLKSGTYYFSFNSSVPLPAGSRVLFIKNGTAEHLVYDNTTVVISENVTYDIGLVLNAGTFLNVVLRPQIEFGNIKTSYEPYNQPDLSYETNIEKKWNSFNIYGNTYQKTRSGKNLFNINEIIGGNSSFSKEIIDNHIVLTATGTVGAQYVRNYVKNVDSSKKYTLSFKAKKDVVGTDGEPTIKFIIYGSNDDNNYTLLKQLYQTNPTQGQEYTFNHTVTGYSYYRFYIYNNGNTPVTIGEKTEYWDIQFEEGNVVTSYEEYGVMPSPDYPSELVSVGYENLCSLGGYTNNATSQYYIVNKLLDNFENNTTYTLSFDITSSVTPFDILIGYGNNSFQAGGITISNQTNGHKTITFTTNNTTYSNLWLRAPRYSNATTFNTTVSNIMLEKGTQEHSYIPYGKYGIEINNFGKNLFDEEQLLKASNWRKNDDGYYYGTRSDLYSKYKKGSGGFTFSASFKENTQYTISFIAYSSVASGNPRLEIYYTDGTSNFTPNYNITTPTLITRTSTAGKTIASIAYGYGSGSNAIDYFKNIQLEENTQATTYEEYKSNSQLYVLDEPLRRIGQYQDRLYVDNGVLFVERKIGKIVLDGSETWAMNPSGLFNQQSNFLNKYLVQNALSNFYENVVDSRINANSSANGVLKDGQFSFRLGTTKDRIYIKKTDITSVNDFKNWLSTHKTEVDYVLTMPTITPIGYVNMPNAYEGQNTAYLYTGLDTRIELWYYWRNYDVLFAGVVKNSGDISLNPRHPHYCSLQILDYKTFLSESNTLDFVIANKTISEAISMVVNAVSGYGFIVGNIDIDSANDIIGAYSTLNKSAYDVLQYLAEISGSRWRARVVDSLTMAIDFYDPDTLPQAEDIEYTKEYWENNNIVDLTFNYGTRDYRNKQILLSDEVYANINYDETLISNGYSNTFTLQNNIGDVVSVVVDGAEKTIGTNNDKQMGVEADFYFTPGKNVIESNSVYSAGTMIHLTYQPLVKGRQIVYNNSEIDRISQQTQTEGVIARYETRNDVLSSDELEKIAKTYIEYKGKAEVILTLRTQNKDLYNIGEVVYFNAPISDLAQNYMVKSKKIEYVVINKIVNLFYIYELTSSFNNEKAINYFDNQRSKATGNIEEGESITRNVDIETQANIIWSDGSVSSATVTVTGDNVLNCALNSPFVE